MPKILDVIWGKREQKYFCKRDSTQNCPTGKSPHDGESKFHSRPERAGTARPDGCPECALSSRMGGAGTGARTTPHEHDRHRARPYHRGREPINSSDRRASALERITDSSRKSRHVRFVPKAEAASIFEPHLLVRGTRVATGDDGVRVGLCENKLTPPSSGQRR